MKPTELCVQTGLGSSYVFSFQPSEFLKVHWGHITSDSPVIVGGSKGSEFGSEETVF